MSKNKKKHLSNPSLSQGKKKKDSMKELKHMLHRHDADFEREISTQGKRSA